MTQFLNSRFSVYAPGTDTYRDNWERIFGRKNRDRVLEETVLARAKLLNSVSVQVVFTPLTFLDLAAEDVAI